jgi:2'-5' RNA ligase
MDSVRAFIAIELPDTVRAALSRLQNDLKGSTSAPVKWVEPGAIHLTLKFLGNISASAISDIAKSLSEGVKPVAPFRLGLGQTGAFPNPHAPRVVWVGLEGDTTALSTLQQSVELAVIPLGFEREQRRFSAHLTLGRVRDQATPADRRTLGEAVASLVIKPSVPFDVSSVSLMRSTLTREGAIYNRLHEAALGGEQRERVVKDT